MFFSKFIPAESIKTGESLFKILQKLNMRILGAIGTLWFNELYFTTKGH